MLYFAYGSNLNHFQMKNRCSGSRYVKKHTLNGYKLCFSHKTNHSIYGHANVVKNNKSKVNGALWYITKKDENIYTVIRNDIKYEFTFEKKDNNIDNNTHSATFPDNEVISALEDIGDKFSTEYPVDTLVYSKDGDILTSASFVEILEIEIALIGN